MNKKKNNKRKSLPKYEVPEEVKEQARVFLKTFMNEQGIKPPELAIKCKEFYGHSDSHTQIY